MLLIGNATPGSKTRTIVAIMRTKRHSKYFKVACFGSKRHYRKDGSCVHTDATLAQVKPEYRYRVRLAPFGDGY